jgi:hypothetical protein
LNFSLLDLNLFFTIILIRVNNRRLNDFDSLFLLAFADLHHWVRPLQCSMTSLSIFHGLLLHLWAAICIDIWVTSLLMDSWRFCAWNVHVMNSYVLNGDVLVDNCGLRLGLFQQLLNLLLRVWLIVRLLAKGGILRKFILMIA